jgi:hypothetical protein
MRPIMFTIMLLGLGVSSASSQDWQPIRDELGKEGAVESGVLRINFPPAPTWTSR